MIPTYLHTLTLPTPFPVGPVNAYLAMGDPSTLIDTGPNDPSTLTALRDQLAQLGLAFRDIRRVIVTHAHVDHFGIAPQIVAESGALVYSHARNRGWLTDFDNEWQRRGEFYRAVFAASGAPRESVKGAGQGLRGLSQYGSSIPAENFVEISDGDEIALGGDREAWRVLFTPGHAGGLVCLYDPGSGTLLSNDHLIRDITSNPILEPPARDQRERPRALVDYIASMQQTAELDVRIALPGHGEPILDVRALVESRVAFHRARCEVIKAHVRPGQATAYEIMQILFPKLKGMDVFLGLSEVIGHLDILEDEELISHEKRDGVWYYSANEK
jgi:glyoxylase-like metal-dependent hydrolase (beta-lactamase superfamily II)